MYSGTTFTKFSGRILGAHQKIDRVARNHLEKIIPVNTVFPKSSKILHFEGRKGPDAIKHKSPDKDEPVHFYSPFDDDDSSLIELINGHYNQLVNELKEKDPERVAFEAAWLAHAVVDGLTPAHHYPYQKEVDELWDGKDDNRDSKMKKLFPPAETKRGKIVKSWKYLGPKGLMSTHGLFELGIAAIIAPLSINEAIPKHEDMVTAIEIGPREVFKRAAREIAVLDMYTRYQKNGWSTKLIVDVRQKLCPTIVQSVTLVWYLALVEAGLVKKPKTAKSIS